MKKIIDLADLMKHEILSLYSAEEQISDGLLKMMAQAQDSKLKDILNNRLDIGKEHLRSLEAIKQSLGEAPTDEDGGGFFSNLFGGSDAVTAVGVEGLIREAGKLMQEEMTPQAMDAAVIGAAQKITHYQIAAYGTAAAYATELKQFDLAVELKKALSEEYKTDDALTQLATGSVNLVAENAVNNEASPNTNEDLYDRLTDSVSIMSSSGDSRDDNS